MNGKDTEWPKISVVTPTYNQVQYIEATIRSVLDQGYPNLEYIIIDGGSTDGTVEVIEKYSEHLAHWVSEPDEGQTDALIKGFDRASGDILCWLNSDDLFEVRALQDVAEIFIQHSDWQVVYGDELAIDVDGRPFAIRKEIPYYRFIWMYDHNYIPQSSTFWRRGIYEQVGGLDPKMELSMDFYLWARFTELTTLHHVPRVWSRFRYHPEAKTFRLRAKMLEEDALIRSRYLPDEAPWLRRLKRLPAKGLRVALKLVRGGYWCYTHAPTPP
jgi:glycosyltransferase involved in cell wall biosynthesis